MTGKNMVPSGLGLSGGQDFQQLAIRAFIHSQNMHTEECHE